MNICVSVFSRFHAFDLAGQLHARGHLGRLITAYPKSLAARFGVPRDRVRSLLAQGALHRLWDKRPATFRPRVDAEPWFHERFDRTARAHIPEGTDIYVGWSSFTEHGLGAARRLGAVTVVERGSAHIEYQRDILREEYQSQGVKAQLPAPAIVDKELREYEISDYISIPSEFVRRSFVERGVPGRKLLVNPYGVDLGQFRRLPRRDHVFRVVFAGAMSLQKGVHYLLRAFAELRLPNAELWLIGHKQPEIESYFRKYEGTFRYLGRVPQAELHKYYSQCSLFALCSIQEGYGMVLLQAMACGLPLLCTTNTGGDDLITEGREGFVVPIRDVDAFKEKIESLYKDREACAEMGRAAQRKVSRGYSWTDYGDRITRAYETILRPHDSR
jgi:glycosyltransferase involved in cell wall biosynthesis